MYEAKEEQFLSMVFFIRRVDEVSDVVGLWVILRLAFPEPIAYEILNRVDAGEEVSISHENDINEVFDINVITPIGDETDVADRVYGFDISAVS